MGHAPGANQHDPLCLHVSHPLNTLPNAPLPTCSAMAYSWHRVEAVSTQACMLVSSEHTETHRAHALALASSPACHTRTQTCTTSVTCVCVCVCVCCSYRVCNF